MPNGAKQLSKTERILSIYHLLTHCAEVSMQELTDQLPGCKKTFLRDMALLKKAGAPVRYSRKRRAFVLTSRHAAAPEFPKSKAEVRYIQKLIRLFTVMDELPNADCDIWYMKTIPGAARRTMQHDFAILNAIGFCIKYEREAWNIHDAGTDMPHGHYYCDRPYGVLWACA